MMHSSTLPEAGCEWAMTKVHRASGRALGCFPKSWPAACKRGPETHSGPVLWSDGRPELKLCSPSYRPVSDREIAPNMLSQRWA